MKVSKVIISILFAVVMSGCSVLNQSGVTEYTLTPIKTESGEVVCCEATVFNSKDYEKLRFVLKKNPDGTIEVELDESGVSASDPVQIQTQNNAKLLDAVTSIIPVVTNGGSGN